MFFASVWYVFLLRCGRFFLVGAGVSVDDTSPVGFVHTAISITNVVLLTDRVRLRAFLVRHIRVLTLIGVLPGLATDKSIVVAWLLVEAADEVHIHVLAADRAARLTLNDVLLARVRR